MADKLSAVQAAMDQIIYDDRVTLEKDGSYTVKRDAGPVLRICPIKSGAEWQTCFADGTPMTYSPTGERPHELIFFALS